jgi:predicted nucleotidyltransferase
MGTTPAEAVRRLRAAVDNGQLDTLVERRGLRLVMLFGSASRDEPTAHDVDIAVSARPGERLDILDVVNDFLDLTGSDDVDVLDLDRAGPVARQHALFGEPLYESEPGLYAREQDRASMERMDLSEWLRVINKELGSATLR